jgi:large subunit ribosomal protein L32
MRVNRSKTAKRRSHHGLTASRVATCECGALRSPHRACANCGKYNGKVTIDIVAKAERAQRRRKRKEAELKQSGQSTGDTEKKTETAAKE